MQAHAQVLHQAVAVHLGRHERTGYQAIARDPETGVYAGASESRKDGQAAGAKDIIDHCRTKIAGYKVPRSVDVIEALPRNASGKILRKDLRAPYWVGYDRQVN